MKDQILQKAKGVRDFLPEEAIKRAKIKKVLRETFELFGYNPIETPTIERYDLLASKFGQGEISEAMQETFKLKDQGGRKLVLRNEFTVPFARFVASNPELRKPFKRYQMGSVFRDGPIKLGRYREFWQCDIDTVGVANPKIDAEILNLVQMVFEKLGLDVDILVNNRKVLNEILSWLDISEEMQKDVIIAIDKLDKIGEEGVAKELKEKGLEDKTIKSLFKGISLKGENEYIITMLENLSIKEGLDEIKETFSYLLNKDNIKFSPSLARGLAYYTGNIFEVVLKDQSKLSSSLAGGGRYDEMIKGFLNSKDNYPTVGISFGLETILDALNSGRLEDQKSGSQAVQKSVVEVYIITIGEENYNYSVKVAESLRKNGIKTDLDFLNKKTGKAMEYANSYGIPWVILIGSDEVETEILSFKNMQSGEQDKLKIEKIIEKISK